MACPPPPTTTCPPPTPGTCPCVNSYQECRPSEDTCKSNNQQGVAWQNGNCYVPCGPGYQCESNGMGMNGTQCQLFDKKWHLDFTTAAVKCNPIMSDQTTVLQCCTQSSPPPNCAPTYTPSGTGCACYMPTYCQGAPGAPPNMTDWGAGGVCNTYFLQQGTSLPANTFKTLIGNVLTGTYTPSNPWNTVAIEYCSKLPGMCDSTLENYCSTVTREQMVSDPVAQNLCGCFMPQDLGHYPFLGQQTPVICDPVCSTATVKQGQDSGGSWTQNTCKETICIIDDVTIDLVNSSGGNITFNQLCGGNCGSGPNTGTACSSCYISGLTVSEVNSDTNGLNLAQNCTSCYQGSTPVSCSTGEPIASGFLQNLEQWIQEHMTVIWGVLGSLVFLFVVIIALLIWRNARSKKA